MRRLGLIGWPVGHSLSPVMHNAAFQAEGLDFRYTLVPAAPADLPATLERLRRDFSGANVTIPHKEAVLPYLDEVDPQAARIGAVNTIVCRDGRLSGHNTDGAGFLASLGGFDPDGKRVVLLGAGGAARALAVSLGDRGARVTVVGRTAARAEAVAALAHGRALGWGEDFGPCDLLVNCTPIGMQPGESETPLPDLSPLPAQCLVADLVYRPLATRLLTEARARGLATADGLGMLVHQAALAWRHWFGRPGPADLMRQAALAALAALEEPH